MTMVSLPSGSVKRLNLVLIETDSFSLVIKGKPYHERYEGLKQYRTMEFQDTMEFAYKGKGIQSVQVFDVE